jgi:UPF0176 protein
MHTNYRVLLYYKYVHIDDPKEVMKDQRVLCESLHLKGRIIIADEGINGTVEGTDKACVRYMKELKKSPLFSDISFKISEGNGNAFPKLSIKVRKEIVTANVDVKPWQTTGKYITAEELHEWFSQKREFYIVDMRNDYEYMSGFFEGSILSGFGNFKDLSSITGKLATLKDKTIVTVCTGGVRCEKASGFLVENGFADVYQLKDGIVSYMEKYPNQHFKGKLYVFDSRLTIGFNTDDAAHEIVGNCMLCGVSNDTYVNCMNHACHKHFICCDACLDKETGLAFCSEECKEIVARVTIGYSQVTL